MVKIVFKVFLLENRVLVLHPEQVVLTRIGDYSDIAVCPQKQGALLLRPWKSTKMTEMAGVTQAKSPFTTNTALTTPISWAGSSDIFYFCPSSKGRGWGGVQRGGGISLKSEEKGGKRRGGVDAGKGSGALLGGEEGSLIFILRVEEPP